MAQSPSHRFGQIIGNLLETGARSRLATVAKNHLLFLDHHGTRSCRPGKKCTWRDLNGNDHDLDFVFERGGSLTARGMPVAFIEIAWRRYTKHSRNKAQEIQGAIDPLAETFRHAAPFKGAILAGEFTDGSLNQLRSLGFAVLYLPYSLLLDVFRQSGVDAYFDEQTSDDEFNHKINTFERLKIGQQKKLAEELLDCNPKETSSFLQSLSKTIRRQIERITILVLHGRPQDVETLEDALTYLNQCKTREPSLPVARFEIDIRFNNGNVIRGSFADKESAIEFLQQYRVR